MRSVTISLPGILTSWIFATFTDIITANQGSFPLWFNIIRPHIIKFFLADSTKKPEKLSGQVRQTVWMYSPLVLDGACISIGWANGLPKCKQQSLWQHIPFFVRSIWGSAIITWYSWHGQAAHPRSSMSNFTVALGGIFQPAPATP